MQALLNIGDFVGIAHQPNISAPMPKFWYMLRLHPNYDIKAERQLHQRGVSVYVPKEIQKVKSVWNRKVTRQVPLFPGSMFVPDFDADLGRLKRMTDGIGGFVKCEGVALRISLKSMEEIRRYEVKQNRNPEKRKFKPGQKVRIINGPFDLCEGLIERLDRKYRLTVLIDFLAGQVPIELDEDEIEAV